MRHMALVLCASFYVSGETFFTTNATWRHEFFLVLEPYDLNWRPSVILAEFQCFTATISLCMQYVWEISLLVRPRRSLRSIGREIFLLLCPPYLHLLHFAVCVSGMNGSYRSRIFSRDGCSPPWMDPRSTRSSPFTSPAPASTWVIFRSVTFLLSTSSLTLIILTSTLWNTVLYYLRSRICFQRLTEWWTVFPDTIVTCSPTHIQSPSVIMPPDKTPFSI